MSFLRHREIYRSDGLDLRWSGAQSAPLHAPTHRFDEFPTGYSLAGCSPAEPASASPADEEFTMRAVPQPTIFQQMGKTCLPACLTSGVHCLANDNLTPSREVSKSRSQDNSVVPASDSNQQSDDKRADVAEVVPPEAEEALSKVLAGGSPKELLSFFASRTTMGPDPETAKVLAEVEKHSEDSRLKGYQATLQTRDRQNDRDHQFRKKQLNHATLIRAVVLATAIAGGAVGLYLYLTGKTEIAGYILLVSLMVLLQVMGGRLPSVSGNSG